VGEGIRHNIALCLPLDAIVADGACRVQRLVDVSRLDDVLAFLRVIAPHAGEAIGLQLYANLQGILLDLAHALPHRLDLVHDAEQLLHVMADLR